MADKSEFEKTAIPHLDAVYRTAFALCTNEADAEDLTQATYVKALERFESFRSGTNCKGWLLRILRNTWIDKLRHKKIVGPQVPIEETVLADRHDKEQTVWTNAVDILENFSDATVIDAMKCLPDEQRLTLFLTDVEQLSHEDVSEITAVPVGTVKSRSSRARSTLREKLLAHAKDLGLAEQRR